MRHSYLKFDYSFISNFKIFSNNRIIKYEQSPYKLRFVSDKLTEKVVGKKWDVISVVAETSILNMNCLTTFTLVTQSHLYVLMKDAQKRLSSSKFQFNYGTLI